MAKLENVVKLLVVETAMEDAELLISVLRNGGLAVRPARADSISQLDTELQNQAFDMILTNLDKPAVALTEVVERVERLGKDIAVLGYAANPEFPRVLDALRQSARDVVNRTSAEHVQLVVRRELAGVMHRRSLRRLEASLRESERRCNALLDSSRDAIAYVHEGMHVYANRAYLERFGHEDFEQIEGMPILDMVDASHAGELKEILRTIRKGEKPPRSIDVRAHASDGGRFDAVMEFSEATIDGEPCTQIVLRDKAVEGVDSEELDKLRNQDLVSGLFNRQFLVNEMETAVSDALSGRIDQALLLLELDNYRNVLETIGIGNADLLLGDVGSLLKQHASESDIIARVSDQTFAILSRARSHDDAVAFASVLRKAFEEHIFDIGSQSLSVPCSFSVVLIGEKGGSARDLLDRAAEALKNAQTEGGNRIQVFDPAEKEKADRDRDQHWLHLVKEALEKDGFVLYYQPMVSLQGAEGEFYEVLLRLAGPKGEILPKYFLPVAERNGLMPRIDRWVIAHAIRVMAERAASGKTTSLFIKIVPATVEDPTLLPWISQQLKTARLRGDRLILEMPESKVVTNLKPVRQFQKGLEQLHCGFALEQFGSGLNSFQLLKHIGANYLKIDRSFMADLPKSKEHQTKIREICDHAHTLGKLTIAEQVEDAASMSFLFTSGVNFVQGNFLQEPEKVMAYEFAG